MLRCCGHKHKTEAAAENCMSKLVDFNYRSSSAGSWDANWHGAAAEEVREDGR
jgi:hypothetical protein